MKQPILSIYDAKAQYYWSPIVSRSIGEAERSFVNEVNTNTKSTLHTNPEDFGLYLIGDFDPITGQISPIQQPRQLLLAQAVKKPAEGQA